MSTSAGTHDSTGDQLGSPVGLTPGGAEIFSPTVEQFDAWIEVQLVETVGLDIACFEEMLALGLLDTSDADVSDLRMLVGLRRPATMAIE